MSHTFPLSSLYQAGCQRTTGSCLAKLKPSRRASPNGADGGKTALPTGPAVPKGRLYESELRPWRARAPPRKPLRRPQPSQHLRLFCTELTSPGPYNLLLSPAGPKEVLCFS